MPDNRELGERLDREIDAALPGYAAAEPAPGIEARILARAFAKEPRGRRRFWAWALPIPAIACALLVLFFLGRTRPEVTPHTAENQAQPAMPAPTADSVPTPALSVVEPKKPRRGALTPQIATRQPPPKLDVFPSPSPFAAQQRALMASTRELPAPPVKTTDGVEIPPIRIAEVRIEPIRFSGDDRSGAFNAPSNSPDSNP